MHQHTSLNNESLVFPLLAAIMTREPRTFSISCFYQHSVLKLTRFLAMRSMRKRRINMRVQSNGNQIAVMHSVQTVNQLRPIGMCGRGQFLLSESADRVTVLPFQTGTPFNQ